MKLFKHLDTDKIKNKKIILDLDGTFLHDKKSEIEDDYKNIIAELKKENTIYLLSNGAKDRTEEISKILGVSFIATDYLKPNKKTVKTLEINFENKHEYVVLGDKFLTDGLLALQLGVPFYHVKSLIHKDENLFNKLIFFVDDIIGQSFDFLKLIRPKQWVKNLLVISPVFFAGQVFNVPILINATFAFLAFTTAASLVYIVNDYIDIENDKLHPKKKYRPLAIGNITNSFLYFASFILIGILASIVFLIPEILPILSLYIFMNLLYTFKLKHIPVYDVVIVAFMYVLRILLGGVATAIYISPWLTICIFFAALFMTCAKRLGEMHNPTRKVLKYYSKESLVALLVSSGTLAMAAYTLYTILVVKSELAIYSCVITVSIFFVIINDILFGSKKIESPEIYLLTNRKVLFLIVIWLCLEVFRIYTT